MAYADFAFYVEQYKGTAVSASEFPALAERASEYIDYITLGKATDTEEVKRACCAMAEAVQAVDKTAAGSSIASETVGSYSVSYRSGADVAAEGERAMYRAAQKYLARTGLLYRGGGC